MESIISYKPLLAVLIPVLVIPVLMSSARRPNVREAWVFAAGFIMFALVVSMTPVILAGHRIELTLFRLMPGADIAFRVDGLGMLFALVASSLYIVTSLYSIGYMRGLKEHGQTRFVSFFALAIASTIGAAFSANLVTLYLFYEMLSLATYPLVAHHEDATSRISARRYLTFILGTSIGLVLPAMIYCYHVTGTLEFSTSGIFAGQLSKPGATVLVLMFVFGFAKAGVMPFHSWLPAAMVAPTPVSALLHAVAVVKVGVFSIVRVLTGIFGVDLLGAFHLGTLVMVIASITILVSSCIALSQDELKRRLAFSTISQLSYIIFGVAMLSSMGQLGGVIHILMHAFGKITLFFCAGGVIGLPPTGGFYSKWHLISGTLEAGQTIFMVVLLLSSFLNACYFLPIVFQGFFGKPDDAPVNAPVTVREANLCLVVPLAITALASMALFFFPQMFVDLIVLGLNL